MFFLGFLGVLVVWEEGIEVNVFGLIYGIDVKDLFLKLLMVGWLEFFGI